MNSHSLKSQQQQLAEQPTDMTFSPLASGMLTGSLHRDHASDTAAATAAAAISTGSPQATDAQERPSGIGPSPLMPRLSSHSLDWLRGVEGEEGSTHSHPRDHTAPSSSGSAPAAHSLPGALTFFNCMDSQPNASEHAHGVDAGLKQAQCPEQQKQQHQKRSFLGIRNPFFLVRGPAARPAGRPDACSPPDAVTAAPPPSPADGLLPLPAGISPLQDGLRHLTSSGLAAAVVGPISGPPSEASLSPLDLRCRPSLDASEFRAGYGSTPESARTHDALHSPSLGGEDEVTPSRLADAAGTAAGSDDLPTFSRAALYAFEHSALSRDALGHDEELEGKEEGQSMDLLLSAVKSAGPDHSVDVLNDLLRCVCVVGGQ